jgi:FkbM family methyltransferase
MTEWGHPARRRSSDRPATFEVRPDTTDEIVVDEVWRENVYAVGRPELAGKRVADLGANIGAFAVWAAWCDAATVVAVEPDPANATQLRVNLALNGVEAVVVEAAIAAESGTVSMRGTAGGAWTTLDDAGPVPAVTWADLCATHGPFDIVKLDTEGAEWVVLPAMIAAPDTIPALLVAEFHGAGMIGDDSRVPPVAEQGAIFAGLAEHGSVEIMGRPSVGGMLRFWRY